MRETIGFRQSFVAAAITALLLAAAGCARERGPGAETPAPREPAAPEPAADATSRWLEPGVWVHARPPSILGESGSEVLWIEEGEGGWTLRTFWLHDPGLRGKSPPGGVERGGRSAFAGETLRLRADALRLTLEGRDGVRRATYRLDGERLVVPAIVEEAPHAWTLIDPRWGERPERARESERFACETDPAVHPTGPARWSMGVVVTPPPPRPVRTYEVVEPPTDGPVGDLRFLEWRDGVPRERLRLTWHRSGVIMTAGPDAYGIRETVYTRVGPERPGYGELIELLRACDAQDQRPDALDSAPPSDPSGPSGTRPSGAVRPPSSRDSDASSARISSRISSSAK